MKSRCEIIFEQSIRFEHTRQGYTRCLNHFRKFVGVNTIEDLLQGDSKSIQEKIEDYVISLKGKISPNTFPTQLAPIFLFYGLNDIPLNKIRIKKLYPSKVKTQGFAAYTREDISFLISNTRKKRSKAIILILSSTGCRVGALCGLKMGDIFDTPNEQCKCLRFYYGTTEEYYGFLTPEATKSLHDYLQERIDNGEKLESDKPVVTLFENYGHSSGGIIKPVTRIAISNVISTIFRNAKNRPRDASGRYSIPTTHGFRKFFNKTMKMRMDVNLSVCEKLMGHFITISLDNAYLPLGKDELFVEFEKAIPDLTIREDERHLIRISELESQRKLEEYKEKENQYLKEEMDILKLRIQRMELSHEL